MVFHFSSWRIFFFTAIITIVVSGCSLTQAKRAVLPAEKTLTPAEKLFRDRHHELAAIPNWSFTGRVAVQRDAEGWSATMHWVQQGQAFRLRIIAPLGRGTYEITREPDKVTLVDAENRIYSAATPEQLLRDATGWELPISNIEYWVRGILASDANPSQLSLNDEGLVTDFAVQGWRVSVLDYVGVEDLQMPRKLFMNYDKAKVRLIISKWEFPVDEGR